MTIDVFTFCDFAQENNGKLTVVGTYNVLNFRSLPSLHQNFFIALRVSFMPEEAGEHVIKFTLKRKEGGEDVLPPLELKTQTVINDGMASSLNLPINAAMINFEREGTYVATVTIDTNTSQSIELYVKANG